MDERTSSYYPPRAGWNRHLYTAAYAVRRQLHLEELNLPRVAIDISAWKIILCLLVPGFSFVHAGWKWFGRGILAAWCAAIPVFLIWLGYPAANVAFGLVMSAHASSIIHFLNRASPGMNMLRRLALSLAVLFVVGQLIYATGLRWFQKHWFMPLRWNEKVYVVNPRTPMSDLHHGDLVAIHIETTGGGGVWIQEGFALDRVLALPGDTVEFQRELFRVNGAPLERRPLMPSSGGVTLAEKTWLVWPSLSTVTRNNVSEDAVASAVLGMAQVRREQIIGRPFQRWFWRDQMK